MHKVSPEQIKQREQEYPDDIDKVPVKARHFDGCKVIVTERVCPGFPKQPRHQPQPDDHVTGVPTGHHKIDPVEDPDLVSKHVRVDLLVREISDLFRLRQMIAIRIALEL